MPSIGVYRLQRQFAMAMTVHWLSVRERARQLSKAAEMNKKLEVNVQLDFIPFM